MTTGMKRRKLIEERYLCTACNTERSSGRFSDYTPTATCDHPINTRKACLKKWVKVQITCAVFQTTGEDEIYLGIKCPECATVMASDNMSLFAEAEQKHIAQNATGWRWCLNSRCRAGQILKSQSAEMQAQNPLATSRAEAHKIREASTQPKSAATDSVQWPEIPEDICTCYECGAAACVPCDRPWHADETCSAFRARTIDRWAEEERGLQEVLKITQPCPGCGSKI
nr:hypothetical protein CFP56_36216 [Quercus suber]